MTNNQIASFLTIILAVAIVVLLILICIFIFLRFKQNQENTKKTSSEKSSGKTKVQQLYSSQSIFNFMEFDKIEDNMIVQKKRKKICNDCQMPRN